MNGHTMFIQARIYLYALLLLALIALANSFFTTR